MKKILSILLIISMLFVSTAELTSCRNNDKKKHPTTTLEAETTVVDTTDGNSDTTAGDTTNSESGDTTSSANDTTVSAETTTDVIHTTESEKLTTNETTDTTEIQETTTGAPETTAPENKEPCSSHVDANNNDYCDVCNEYLIVLLDFYSFNDLHGKFCDTSSQPGVDEIGTYIDNRSKNDDNIILISTGDMWQGTAESALLRGQLLVEWMNTLGFVSMTLGNHEFDWGEDAIAVNLEIADFPFLAINVYDKRTGKLADYCTPSVMIERDGIQIGIIGAIGDCYSSISSDMVQNVTFKVGNALTSLVKAESERLRGMGADVIVYTLHDGGDNGSSHYDSSLSNGYVDVVFEGHTHKSYSTVDSYGVYHIQGGGENSGLSHVEIAVNSANGNKKVTEANIIKNSEYKNLPDHGKTEALESKYSDIIEYAYADLGTVSSYMDDSKVEDFVAQLYLEAGLEKWGETYNIVLGGGFLKTRSPYNLSSGTKTYADIFSLLPFNNKLVLCSISGSKLKSRFINSTNDDYHLALSDYGKNLTISNNARYYVIVDTYSAFYSYNGLTIVDYLDDTTYARDLFADAIKDGRLK